MAEPEAPPIPAGLVQDRPLPWQPVWGEKDGLAQRAQYALFAAALGLVVRAPEGVVRVLVDGLGVLGHKLDRRHADAARRFLTQALGDEPPAVRERRVRQAFRHFFRVVIETERFLHRVPVERVREHFEVEWTDDARRARDQGGCVMVTPHIGLWELSVFIAPWIGFDPLYAVGKPPKSRPLSRAMQRSREHYGMWLLPRRGAMAGAPKIVARGGALGLLLDQRARTRPVLAEFFGRPARCDRSAGVLLRRLKVPIVSASVLPTDEPLRYRFVFGDVLWPEDLAGADPAGIARRLNQIFEQMIRAHPDQYFWLHDRYKDTPLAFPEGAAGVAAASATDPSEA